AFDGQAGRQGDRFVVGAAGDEDRVLAEGAGAFDAEADAAARLALAAAIDGVAAGGGLRDVEGALVGLHGGVDARGGLGGGVAIHGGVGCGVVDGGLLD